MTSATPEQQLIRQARGGSTAAFGRLVGVHQQTVRAFLRRLCGTWSEADDLAQETFVRAWVQIARFDPEMAFRPWLFGIAYRKFLASRRAFFRRRKHEQAAMENRETSTNPGPAAEKRLDLQRALQALPEEPRAVIALCLAAGFSHAEAAEALGLPLGTVKSHIQRGRMQIAAVLGDGYV